MPSFGTSSLLASIEPTVAMARIVGAVLRADRGTPQENRATLAIDGHVHGARQIAHITLRHGFAVCDARVALPLIVNFPQRYRTRIKSYWKIGADSTRR
jgi:hypothetical protein